MAKYYACEWEPQYTGELLQKPSLTNQLYNIASLTYWYLVVLVVCTQLEHRSHPTHHHTQSPTLLHDRTPLDHCCCQIHPLDEYLHSHTHDIYILYTVIKNELKAGPY